MTDPKLEDVLRMHTAPANPALVRDEGEGRVRCLACGHACLISPGRSGVCRVRSNVEGELCVPFGYVAGLQCDPIGKKPFYHVLPGTEALSFGMLGCNYKCSFCQNWISSQVLRDPEAVAGIAEVSAKQIAETARQHGAPSVISTYNEPLITSDWAAVVFEEARRSGLKCGYVSNGHASREVLDFLCPLVDMFKVDLKCFSEDNYRRLGGKLSIVLETIRTLKEKGVWVEIVTLVIPEFNDSPDELRSIARFIASVSSDIPWHVTAFHPTYKMTDRGRTPMSTLELATRCGREEGLHFVYAGNTVIDGDFENTRCPACNLLLIERHGYHVLSNVLPETGKCPGCGATVPGIWQ